MTPRIRRYLMLVTISASATSAFGMGAEVRSVDAVPEENGVRIEVELSSPVTPTVTTVANPCRLIIDFSNVSLNEQRQKIQVNKNGVNEVRVLGLAHGSPLRTRIEVGIDTPRPYGITTIGNKFVLSILPHPGTVGGAKEEGDPRVRAATIPAPRPKPVSQMMAAFSNSSPPQVEHLPLESTIEEPQADGSSTARRSFKVKYVAGSTVYIDGGSNSGLKLGMKLDVHGFRAVPASGEVASRGDSAIGSLRVVGVATTSAITDASASGGEVKAGDRAELTAQDAAEAAANLQTEDSSSTSRSSLPQVEADEDSGPRQGVKANTMFPMADDNDTKTRVAGRIGLDYSGITSTGSTPGTTTQTGMSFQSDMTHLFGTHWNLQGYWRGRINRHSQFKEATIDDTLNKTYTMQLYYDNPNSKWVAGVGRLYLPWAVSLDTIDGGYLGRKAPLGMTAGVFAGSTPDLTSWNYQPDHRIAGSFVNFEHGAYEALHFTSTTGLALSTIDWKLDRPYAFFENELCYKGVFSLYHSLIADSPRGVSTNGIKPSAGISHSYFTTHYQPSRKISFDLYHNYFRDVPTATTTVVSTGLVDKLLFQGVSAGVHVKPTRKFTLYTTLGASEKTGDTHRSLNEMYGGTWSEIGHSGLRADYHYSKFDSNFGSGHYNVLSLSRQLTNRMFSNLQIGKQDMLSQHTANYNSIYFANSVDLNIGRHSYLQSGYTYVNGASMNYRQLYFSWGYRFDKGKNTPEYVQTMNPVH